MRNGLDPRFALGTKCERARKREADLIEQKRDFFGSLGKLGQLDILNDIGAGKIGKGLRVLDSISDLVRVGKPPKEAQMDPETGAYYTLDTMGMPQTSVRKAGSFNPGVANRGYSQAKILYEKVKAGDFKLEDAPEYIADFKNLSKLITGIFTGEDKDPREYKLCEATPYAMDLIRYAPKFKYMFAVEFVFSDAYRKAMSEMGYYLAFVVKSSTRPKINFEYEELNMYNFRTQAIKRTKFEPMNIKFLDDNQNKAGKFHATYLSIMSPQTNMSSKYATKAPFEESGMDFTNLDGKEMFLDASSSVSLTAPKYASSTGQLVDDTTINVLKEVRLYHFFNYGRQANTYTFINPKITGLDLDDLDMAAADSGGEMSLDFVYDSINVTTDIDLSTDKNKKMVAKVTGDAIASNYPIISVHASGEKKKNSSEDDSFFGKIAKDVGDVVDSVTGAISDAFDTANDFLGDIMDSAENKASEIYSSIDKAAGDAYDSGKRTVKDAIKKSGIF